MAKVREGPQVHSPECSNRICALLSATDVVDGLPLPLVPEVRPHDHDDVVRLNQRVATELLG